MGYYDNKVPDVSKINPTAIAEIYAEWILELQGELKRASRQVDRLEHKLLIRSKRLGEARAERDDAYRAADPYCCDSPAANALPARGGW